MRCLFGLFLLVSSCAIFQPKTTQTVIVGGEALETGETRPPGTWHQVIKGETLWTIAQHYRVQVADLVSANVILDPTRLDVGRRVFVPLKPGADPDERKLLEASKPATILQVEGEIPPPPGGFRWPLKRPRILRSFASRGESPLDGLELGGKLGEAVTAIADGDVVFAAHDPRGWGHLVILTHGKHWVSIYAYNQKILVKEGQRVQRGQSIARLGQSGRAKRPQLHLEIRRGVRPVDPGPLLPKR
ncbi:MAG: peptidoglycan DD-metalloendopeptidase family protein [Myxococcota bacterium]|nr:hypothetical protein [Myxococcales bacterium]MEC7751486.1 peptidoglycan DD-metalloendopeptidase family protein [Myxococcota bacterium]HBU47427.1 hypothetical protein [Myxococcales bacterium]